MTEPGTRLASICLQLNEEGAQYLVIGSRALQLWGSVTPALDIQLLIEPTPVNAGRVLRGLRRAGFGFARDWLAAEVAGRQVTVLGRDPRVDIVTVASGVRYRQAAVGTHPFVIEGVTIPTASLEDLITTKRTGRPEDAGQIRLLEEIQRRQAG